MLKYPWYYNYPGSLVIQNSKLSFYLGQFKDKEVVLDPADATIVAATPNLLTRRAFVQRRIFIGARRHAIRLVDFVGVSRVQGRIQKFKKGGKQPWENPVEEGRLVNI